MFEVDDLKVWMGEPYVINDKISVFQPSLRDIINASEREYFSMVQTICSTSSNMKSQLDSMGLDWEKIEELDCKLNIKRYKRLMNHTEIETNHYLNKYHNNRTNH